METWGPPDFPAAPGGLPARSRQETVRAAGQVGERTLTGMACSAGVVQGVVRVVREPDRALELRGCIVVAERTDPGWTVLFPGCAGLLVQRGNLLSHSAIVARELGLPCIVAIPDLLERVRDGDRVEMDGAQGVVRLLDR